MKTHALRPWTDLVKLHPDVEAGALTEAVFAIDLGAIAANDSNVPVVNRDPEAFFRATYLTADLRKLLDEVLASLSGKSGYNRVLKLRVPFGGGKSHTLASLFHAARKREALDGIPEAKEFARPGNVAVAVFDGEKFDARNGKTLKDGRTIQTMWGWIAWQIDPEKAFPLVAEHDKDRVSPGGDVIRELLTKGASGRPVLILLDEVLKYMERSAAVSVLDSPPATGQGFLPELDGRGGRGREGRARLFTWAPGRLGNVGLLAEIDKLASRWINRGCFGMSPADPSAASSWRRSRPSSATEVSGISGRRDRHAACPCQRRRNASRLRKVGCCVTDAGGISFHPALIDIMRNADGGGCFPAGTRRAAFFASRMHFKKNSGATLWDRRGARKA